MILPKIALRNLSRQLRRSILLGGALSFGMFILVAVNGVTGGLVSSLQKNFAGLVGGHIFFLQLEKDPEGRLVNMVKDDSAFIEALENSGIRYKSMTRQTSILASIIFSGEAVSRSLTGVNWAEEGSFADKLDFAAGSADNMAGSDGILISLTLAENVGLLPKKSLTYGEKALVERDVKIKWKAEGKNYDLKKAVDAEVKRLEAEREAEQNRLAPAVIGEEVLAQFSTVYGQQNVASFQVRGIFRTQVDYAAYVDLGVLNAAADMGEGTYNLLGLVLEDYSSLDMKTLRLHTLLQGKYDLVPYQKLVNKAAQTAVGELEKEDFTGSKTIVTNLNNELGSFVQILTAVQAGSFGLFLVIILVVMVGLVNTFRIVVYERTKEIGTMRALGAQRSQVRRLFILEALFLALAGTLPGTLLGYLLLWGIGFIKIDAFTELSLFLDNGYISHSMSASLLAVSYLMVVILTLIAALLPARRAAKLDPAAALRTQF